MHKLHKRSSMLGPPPSKPIDPEETCLSQGPPPDAAMQRALALSAREVDDGGLQRALALSAAEARTEVVDLTLSQGSEGVSRTADDSQVEATQLEETQLVAPPPRRSVVDVSSSPPAPAPDAAAAESRVFARRFRMVRRRRGSTSKACRAS